MKFKNNRRDDARTLGAVIGAYDAYFFFPRWFVVSKGFLFLKKFECLEILVKFWKNFGVYKKSRENCRMIFGLKSNKIRKIFKLGKNYKLKIILNRGGRGGGRIVTP